MNGPWNIQIGTSFEKFVKVKFSVNPDKNEYDGFCIELFYEVLDELDHALPYQFAPYRGSYDVLVYHVYKKVKTFISTMC